MIYRIDCEDEYELAEIKADIIEQGYRYVCIGLTVRYWK